MMEKWHPRTWLCAGLCIVLCGCAAQSTASADGATGPDPSASARELTPTDAPATQQQGRQGAQLLRFSQAPLRTHGRYIVNNKGERVKWGCVNWYGAYSSTHAVGGLEVQKMDYIVQRIVDLGFNCVRMMYSIEGWVHNPLVANGTLAANPQLQGMRWLQIFDITMQAMTDAGLMVILNNHNSKSGWCCHFSQDEGLWYAPPYTEAQWIDSLVNLTLRYKDNKLVVAIDLRNEVHDYEDTHLSWGDGDPKTDWALAATKAGNAVLAANPDVIIVVMAMCFGMDLRAMREKPIELSHPNRVVYQTHNYLEYQVFDNVAAMLGSWGEIRMFLFWWLVALLLITLLLLRCWYLLGNPCPRKGTCKLSVGLWWLLWMIICFSIAVSTYNFGKKFCTIALHTDVVPWIVGFAVFAILFLLMAIVGLVQVKPWQLLSKAQTQPDDDGLDAAGVTPDVPQQTSDENTAEEQKTAGFCRRFVSWQLGALLLKRDAKWLVYDIILKRPSDENRDYRMKPAADWDGGLLCGLQFMIVLVSWLLILLCLIVWANIFPTYWWMERHLDGLWGYALEDGFSYTAPIWMGEFGQEVRGQYWLNFVRYLSSRDVDFAYWALNGLKYTEGKIDTASGNWIKYDTPRWTNETFGILSHDYSTVRNPWMMLDLQALMQSPATWIPDGPPCNRQMLGGSCGAR
jgi:hypothetical protein